MKLNIQDANIYVADIGKGEPTLFLHGLPDSGDVWSSVTAALSNNFRCLIPDLPGFGRSSVPPNLDLSLDGMADFINALVTALGISEPLNLVVHDIGGPYGLAWAVRYPAKVKRIVIMNTVFQSEYQWHRYGRICRTPLLGELLQLLTTQSGLAREMRNGSGMNKPTRAHIAATYRWFGFTARRMVLRLYRALNPKVFAGWDSQLRDLASSTPSLVMWGDLDPYIPSSIAERFGAQQVRHFPDCGHWLQVETPDIVSSALLDFLNK
jgi:pimeloyl-ACP methyl ester carboxylesterase